MNNKTGYTVKIIKNNKLEEILFIDKNQAINYCEENKTNNEITFISLTNNKSGFISLFKFTKFSS